MIGSDVIILSPVLIPIAPFYPCFPILLIIYEHAHILTHTPITQGPKKPTHADITKNPITPQTIQTNTTKHTTRTLNTTHKKPAKTTPTAKTNPHTSLHV